MKKLLFILFVFVCAHTVAQPRAQIGAGVSTQHYPIADVSVGYQAGTVFVQGGYLATINRNVDGGTYLNFQAGVVLPVSESIFTEISAGYASIMRSNDHKEMNGRGMIYTGGFGKLINGNAIVLKGSYCQNVTIATLSIRYNF